MGSSGSANHQPACHVSSHHHHRLPSRRRRSSIEASPASNTSSSSDDHPDAKGARFHPHSHHHHYNLREHYLQTHQHPQSSSHPNAHTHPPRRRSRPELMPRRKETKRIVVESDPPVVGEPHTVFRENGSPIISPRSIRTSLAETDFDLDGNPRHKKKPTTIAVGEVREALATTSVKKESTESETARDVDRPSPSTPSNSSANSQEDDEDDVAMTSGASQQTAMESERALSRPSGVQLWVHRLLATHMHTLQLLNVDQKDFPNTRLSLKQLESLLGPVISLTNLMTPAHFGIHVPTPQIARTMKDVHYWKLWESDTIDIGIFFMPPNAVIPLHNHPGMSVITRILYGSVNVTSYDLLTQSELDAISTEEHTSLVDKDDDGQAKWARVTREGQYVGESTMWLDPRRFNLHQIQANAENGCALLDIMIPPYNNADRDCHHFNILQEKYLKRRDQRIVQMIETIAADHHNPQSASSSDPKPASPVSS